MANTALLCGVRHGWQPVYVPMWLSACPQVVGVKTNEVHGYTALQLGAGHKRQKCMSPSAAGWFLKVGWGARRQSLLTICEDRQASCPQ